MSKEFLLFEKEEINFTTKFMKLQDLLVTNKSSSRLECIIFFTIFYLQTLSGFYSENLKVMDIKNSSSDYILNYINKGLRIKDLFLNNYNSYQAVLITLFVFIISSTIYYFYVLSKINNNSYFSLREHILNIIIKVFLLVLFKPILDFSLANVCFKEFNPNFSNVSCIVSDNKGTFIIGMLLFAYSIFLNLFINLFYNDSQFLLQNSYYSRMNCGYENYIALNHVFYAILLSQSEYLGKDLFFVYNIIVSLFFLKFYYDKYLFYDKILNTITGLFHIVYVWTSFYFFIFSFIEIKERGIIYVIGMLLIVYLYWNLRYKIEEMIFLNLPFNKILNKNHILFYIKSLMEKINNIDSNIQDKAHMIGVIQTHILECPQSNCISKDKSKKIFLPMAEEWSERNKPEISDRVFLLNFILIVIDYYIQNNNYTADLIINLSLYYLTVIGNNCKAMLYYNKVKEMNLSIQERFAVLRLYFQISRSLVNKLKTSSEGCLVLDDLNVTLYFKYEDLSQKFFDEINNDISLSLEFWKNLKQHHETSRIIDFNKIFSLTDKIRKSKTKIEKIWNDIFNTYSGVNDLFDLYENYVEQINDDDLLKRELDSIRSKNVSSSEHIQVNYYNLLFNKNTGIIIANGHKYKEGIIEKANDEIERIFDYKADDLKGMNVTKMIPRAVAKKHRLFMERYNNIAEKRVLDRQLRTYARDKENCIIPIQLYVKLFPMVADYTYFCGLIFKENLDDLIIVDKKFNIQSCSRKLMDKMEISNKLLFEDNDIPFYIICKKFVNFFKVFLKKNKKKILDASQINYNEFSQKEGEEEEIEDYDINENVEVSENTELEYELKIPKFLLEYICSANTKNDSKVELALEHKNNIDPKDNNEEKESTVLNTIQIADEEDILVQEQTKEENIDYSNNQKFGFDKQQDEEREFENKIFSFRKLFEYGKFQELEDLIEKYSKDSDNREYNFNFTFLPYRFGENDMLYIIRCIDNKSEFDDGGSSGDSRNNINNNNLNNKETKEETTNKNFISNHLKKKQIALVNLAETTNEERKVMLSKSQNYFKMCNEDSDFIRRQYGYKEEIANFSKIFGLKKEENQRKIKLKL